MDIQALLKEYVEENGSVGAAVSVIDQGRAQFFFYGTKSIEGGEPISEETLFEIGSITKVFTTLLLMDMVSKGEVQLDDPIEMYLSGVRIPEKNGKKITLRHLAMHDSGLPRIPDNLNPQDNPLNPYADYSIDTLYQFLNLYALQREPGELFEYSNLGMGLLGHILSKQAGQNYEELIRSRICDKLGMKDTAITLTANMKRDFAKGHYQRQKVEPWDIPTLAGAGALRSNIKDMSKFLIANMGFANSPLVELMKQCHAPQRAAESLGAAIGLGWLISTVIWHNGGTGGFYSFLGFNPKTQKGIVVLSNSTEGWPDAFALCLLDPATYKKACIDQTLSNDRDYLKRFEGAYETITPDQQKMEITIKLSDSRLICTVLGSELDLLPESFGVFHQKGTAGQKWRFIFDNEDKMIKAQILMLPDNAVVAEILPVQSPQDSCHDAK